MVNESVEARFIEGPPSFEDLFRCTLIDYAAARGKTRCGEKSPWHLLALPELMAIYPRAKFLWMIRDGRDVVQSCRHVPFFTWEPDWWHCQTWCRAAALGESYQRRHPDRVLTCRFESLVEEPVAVVRHIDEFLGLPFETSQLKTSCSDAAVSSGEWWKWRAGRQPDAGRAYAWRESLPAARAQYLTALMNPYLVHHGYDSYWSPRFGGPKVQYYGYRALASLLRVSLMSSTATRIAVRTVQGPWAARVADDIRAVVRSEV